MYFSKFTRKQRKKKYIKSQQQTAMKQSKKIYIKSQYISNHNNKLLGNKEKKSLSNHFYYQKEVIKQKVKALQKALLTQ